MKKELQLNNLTPMEQTCMVAHLKQNGCGAKSCDDLLSDNFSWARLDNLVKGTKFDVNTIKGVLGSLMKKGIVHSDTNDDGETLYFVSENFLEANKELSW